MRNMSWGPERRPATRRHEAGSTVLVSWVSGKPEPVGTVGKPGCDVSSQVPQSSRSPSVFVGK